MHCLERSCASACFSKALRVDPATHAVVYIPELCVGCRYCMLACPFEIPRYQWDEALPLITKCQLCVGRLKAGDAPACVSACPTGALTFGDRDELLPEAFTIKELQNLYEAILDVRFDRRNFYNKMKRLGMLEQLDETVNPSQKKEAFLFRFNKAKYEELKQKGFRLEF